MSQGVGADPLAGKVAVITGGGSGIGLALAERLVAADCSVLLTGRRSGVLEQAAATLRNGPGAVATLPLDVAEPAAGQQLVDAALERFGRLDIAVANAGTYLPGDVREIDPVAADALVRTNITGVIGVVQAAASHLAGAGGGDVLVTSSVSGHQAIHWEPVYSASKHAVQAFVHGVRRQLVGSGVRIGAVAPGVVLNDLWNATDDEQRTADVAAGLGMYSEDVADAMVFMLTRPRHVVVRDLVLLPVNQEI